MTEQNPFKWLCWLLGTPVLLYTTMGYVEQFEEEKR